MCEMILKKKLKLIHSYTANFKNYNYLFPFSVTIMLRTAQGLKFCHCTIGI